MNETTPAAAEPVPAPEGHDPSKIFQTGAVGPIAYGPGGPYSGCLLKVFTDDANVGGALGKAKSAVENCNEFFRTHINTLVVGLWPDQTSGDIIVLYTRTLDDDEMEVMRQRGHIIDKLLKEFRAERDAAKQAAEDRVNAEHERLVSMAEKGEHCEKNHGGVVKQLRAKAAKSKKGE